MSTLTRLNDIKDDVKEQGLSWDMIHMLQAFMGQVSSCCRSDTRHTRRGSDTEIVMTGIHANLYRSSPYTSDNKTGLSLDSAITQSPEMLDLTSNMTCKHQRSRDALLVSSHEPGPAVNQIKAGSISSFIAAIKLEEPSAQALKEYHAYLTSHAARNDGATTKTLGKSSNAATKLPAHVPRVNSRWNVMPGNQHSRRHQHSNELSTSRHQFCRGRTISVNGTRDTNQHIQDDGISIFGHSPSSADKTRRVYPPPIEELYGWEPTQTAMHTAGNMSQGSRNMPGRDISNLQNSRMMLPQTSPTRRSQRGIVHRIDDPPKSEHSTLPEIGDILLPLTFS